MTSSLPIVAGTFIAPGTNLFVFVRDKFGETYWSEVIVGPGSEITITDEMFPNLFNPNSGIFTIFVKESWEATERIILTFEDMPDVDYKCITYKNIC